MLFRSIRFEDKKDQEEFFMQAERAMTIRVKGGERHGVGGGRSVSVGGYQTTKIKKDHNVEVVEGDYNIAVKEKHLWIDVPNAEFQVLGKNIWQFADQEFVADVYGNAVRMNRDSVSLTGTSELTAGVAGNTIHMDAGALSITGIMGITLTCGGSKIEMTPLGIAITSVGAVDVKGLPIKLNT